LFSIIIHDTVRLLVICPHQHFVTCTNVNCHSFNVPLQGFLCQFQFLELTPRLSTTETGCGYSEQGDTTLFRND